MKQWTLVCGVLSVLLLGCGTKSDSAPVADATADIVAIADTAIGNDTAPALDVGTGTDVPVVTDTAPTADSVVIHDAAPVADATAVSDASAVVDIGTANDTAPSVDIEPSEDVVLVDDTAAVEDVLIAPDTVASNCDESKLGFSADNPSMFEFYELCIPKGDEALVAQLQVIDSTLYCGVGGIFAQCAKNGLNGCHGDLVFEPGSKVIAADKWSELCALSLLDGVSTIAGGHWL